MHANFSRHLHLTSRAVSGLLVGGVLGVMLAVALLTRMEVLPTGSSDADERISDPVREAIDRHRCSTRGFGDDAIPSSALVRTGAGDLLLVTFDRGWRLHQNPRTATVLVAVCLDDLPPGTHQKRP